MPSIGPVEIIVFLLVLLLAILLLFGPLVSAILRSVAKAKKPIDSASLHTNKQELPITKAESTVSSSVVLPKNETVPTKETFQPQFKSSNNNFVSEDTRRLLYEILVSKFSLSELQDLCFIYDLVGYEELRGETIRDKSRELIRHCERRNSLNSLIAAIKKERKDLDI